MAGAGEIFLCLSLAFALAVAGPVPEAVPGSCRDLYFSTAATQEVYIPLGECVNVQADPSGTYRIGLNGVIQIQTAPAARISCRMLTYDVSQNGSLVYTSSPVGLLHRCGSENYCPSPIVSPTQELGLDFNGGNHSARGPQLECKAEQSPCGVCGSGDRIRYTVDPVKRPSITINSVSDSSRPGMSPGCLCRYRIDAVGDDAVGLIVNYILAPPGTKVTYVGECQGSATLNNGTARLERSINMSFLSPQFASQWPAYQLTVSVRNQTSALRCPHGNSTSPPISLPTTPNSGLRISGGVLAACFLVTAAVVGVGSWCLGRYQGRRSEARKQQLISSSPVSTSQLSIPLENSNANPSPVVENRETRLVVEELRDEQNEPSIAPTRSDDTTIGTSSSLT